MDTELSPEARHLLLALLDGGVLVRKGETLPYGNVPHFLLDGKSADLSAINELADLEYIDDGQPQGDRTPPSFRIHLTPAGERAARALRSGTLPPPTQR